jgi:Putative peptidoglycan binding domain
MKTRMLMAALLASAALVAPAEAGNGHHGGGGGGFVAPARSSGGGGPSFRSMPAGRFGGGASFRSMPMRSFSGNRTIYSGQRFSSVGPRVQSSAAFRPQQFQSNVGASLAGREFARGNVNRVGRVQGFANGGSQAIGNVTREGNGQFRNRGNQFQNGNGFARNNAAIRNQRTGPGQVQNGNARLRADWRNHVFAQRSANWHRDWDRDRDHWWNGHRCHFFNGSWVIFDAGFYPWWPWGYPYDYYYGYGYGYPYNYGYYPYNYGYNSYDYGYDQSGAYDNSAYGQSGYSDQDANSTVAAVQDRLAREGYYRGQIDGVLGPETRHAILRYQSNHGLRVTGELSADTLNALGLQEYGNYSSY